MNIGVNIYLILAALLLSGCGHTVPMMGPQQNVYNPYLPPQAAPQNQVFSQNPYLGDPGLVQAGSYAQNTYQESSYGNTYSNYEASESSSGYGFNAIPDAGDYLPEVSYQASPSASPQSPEAPLASTTPVIDKAPEPIPASTFSSVSDELNILTLNVWGLPGPLVEARTERLERLGAQLNAYDVVTLQETFSNDIEVLKQTTGFAYHSRNDNSSFYRLGSGLYTLSKYPIIKTDAMSFGRCTVADCLARKGVYFTRIDHPKIGPIDIYTTHYQAEDKETSREIRIEENNRVLQEIVHRNRSEYPVVITGDFNFIPDQAEYLDLMARLPLVDSFRQLHPDQAGYTSHPDNPYKADKVGKSPKRLDYIFYLPKDNVNYELLESTVTLDSPVDGYVLSDHYGVEAKIRIQTQQQ